ncbi:MAG TPA: response regulator transcription factor [Candidatus Limnocylindrales bacterium]|jgi:DNA-binding NarL/FixJ family response regulator|nr:response regulator transcription factor [Candidatus Limnocylindrales bacterium]
MKKITVLLSDDHAVFREGLRSLLQATDDIDVIGEAEDGHSAVAEAIRLQPDVVLMDIAMPRLNGVEAARRIARQVPAAKVLILSTYSDDQHVQQAIEAGASGYFTKTAPAAGLLRAVRRTGKTSTSFSQSIASRLLKPRQKRELQSKSNATLPLSSRQTEVLQLIAEGCSNKRIASLLSVSPKTVEKHRQLVMDKLDIHEVATLTRYAISSGLVESAPASGSGALERW